MSDADHRYRLAQCQHDPAQGGRPGAWFVLDAGSGEGCHRGAGYQSREEAAEAARLKAWLEAAIGIYTTEIAPSLQPPPARRSRDQRRGSSRR